MSKYQFIIWIITSAAAGIVGGFAYRALLGSCN